MKVTEPRDARKRRRSTNGDCESNVSRKGRGERKYVCSVNLNRP
jgi:hypothetical protein